MKKKNVINILVCHNFDVLCHIYELPKPDFFFRNRLSYSCITWIFWFHAWKQIKREIKNILIIEVAYSHHCMYEVTKIIVLCGHCQPFQKWHYLSKRHHLKSVSHTHCKPHDGYGLLHGNSTRVAGSPACASICEARKQTEGRADG